ncbi:hypothetical protein J6590_076486 [Homalodisca vitripennis]|nr:hypothetical protein J6590_076486 [Homalodisca vitripennis]
MNTLSYAMLFLFLWGVLRGTVDCSDLLCRIDLRASRLTRSCNLIFGRSHPTNYIMHGPLPRLHRLGNQLCRQFDFFEDSQSAIRGFFQSQVPRVAPSNSSVAQNNSSVAQNNSSVAPNNSSVAPNNTSVAPNNSSVAPNNSSVAPNNSSVAQNNSSVAQNNSSVAPNNYSVAPNNSSVAQNNSSVAQNNSSVAPNNSSVKQCGTKQFQCGTKQFQCGTKQFKCGTKQFQCDTKFQCGTKQIQCGTKQFHIIQARVRASAVPSTIDCIDYHLFYWIRPSHKPAITGRIRLKKVYGEDGTELAGSSEVDMPMKVQNQVWIQLITDSTLVQSRMFHQNLPKFPQYME